MKRTEIYLDLWTDSEGNTTAVSVNREDALKWTKNDFIALYEHHMKGCTQKEARLWAEKQVAERQEYLDSGVK